MKDEAVKILHYEFKCPHLNNNIAKVEAHFVNYGKKSQYKKTHSCHNLEDCDLTDKLLPAHMTNMNLCHWVLNVKNLKPLEETK